MGIHSKSGTVAINRIKLVNRINKTKELIQIADTIKDDRAREIIVDRLSTKYSMLCYALDRLVGQ